MQKKAAKDRASRRNWNNDGLETKTITTYRNYQCWFLLPIVFVFFSIFKCTLIVVYCMMAFMCAWNAMKREKKDVALRVAGGKSFFFSVGETSVSITACLSTGVGTSAAHALLKGAYWRPRKSEAFQVLIIIFHLPPPPFIVIFYLPPVFIVNIVYLIMGH